MNIKEIVLIVYLFFINIYKNIIDFFNCKKVEDNKKDNESTNDHQLLVEELAEEVIERIDTDYIVNDVIESIKENYHLFKKEE